MGFGLPDSSTGGVIVEGSGAVFPLHVATGLGYPADDADQLYGGALFVEFVVDEDASVVYDLHPRHWKGGKIEKFPMWVIRIVDELEMWVYFLKFTSIFYFDKMIYSSWKNKLN